MRYTVIFRHFGYSNEVILTPLTIEAETQTDAVIQALEQAPWDWELIDSRLATDPEPPAWRYVLVVIIIFIVIAYLCQIL